MSMVKRTEIVSGLPIHIIDDVVASTEIESFYNVVVNLPFQRAEKDFDGDQHPIFSVEFFHDRFETQMTVGIEARKLLDMYYPDNQYKLNRAYINMSHYGDV